MSRMVIIATAILVGLALAAVVLLGAFPPKPHRAPVEHVVPNDRFKAP
jgi:hypothetical protein